MSNHNIHITGGAGFIGSNVVRHFNGLGVTPYIYDTVTEAKWRNLNGLSFVLKPRDDVKPLGVSDVLIHLGANVNTKEAFNETLWNNNFNYSLGLFSKTWSKIIYASSGAVYGDEETDFKERIYGLKQLNAYGFSKWALDEALFGMSPRGSTRKNIYALRFFNVYGPNEVHKGDMQSVVSLAINKAAPLFSREVVPHTKGNESIDTYTLFRSGRPDIKDGEQKRDFIYVEDVADVISFFAHESRDVPERGIYNLGSGQARTFVDLIKAVDSKAVIQYASMPDNLAKSYQYFTQADMTKLRQAGYSKPFTSLEEGVCKTIALTSPKRLGK